MSSVIKHTAFSPFITGALLYILTRGPPSLRNLLVRRFSSNVQITRLITSLKWLFALGLGRQVNSWLSTWARNNWQWKNEEALWRWSEEVAVVTGGSNGIGALVARALAVKGIKVAVIDVQPLPEDLQNCKSFPTIYSIICKVLISMSQGRTFPISTATSLPPHRSKKQLSPFALQLARRRFSATMLESRAHTPFSTLHLSICASSLTSTS